jgi:predicted O-methyltransferase YrrM
MDADLNEFVRIVHGPIWTKYKPTTAAYGIIPLLQDLGDGIRGVEVGVCLGINSHMMLESCPGIAELIGVDHYKAYMDWDGYVTQSRQDNAYEQLQANLFHIGPRFRHMKLSSTDAAAAFADGELDFVFIDADHSMRAVLQDLDAWWPKIRVGGIMSGHDSNLFSVNFAVTSWAKRHGVDPTGMHTSSNEAWWWRKV